MAKRSNNGSTPRERTDAGINRIVVGGYKSIRKETSIEVRPLTILAGANSSGKSSIMQPLLLLKQTLEAPYDPGPLLLNGTHIKFTFASQLLTHGLKTFHVGIESSNSNMVTLYFTNEPGPGFHLKEMRVERQEGTRIVSPSMTSEEISSLLGFDSKVTSALDLYIRWVIERVRCFFEIRSTSSGTTVKGLAKNLVQDLLESMKASITEAIEEELLKIIHVPSLRGILERTYPLTAVSDTFSGTFDAYVASVIVQWQSGTQPDKLQQLNNDLRLLGLTSIAVAERVSDTEVRIQVGRLVMNGKKSDLVNVSDVGFGVSQALPVLVALIAAEPGQLVYIEQPEIHLHPRAQSKMAEVLAAAARRGVKVVVETHSSILLLGIQTLVAKGELDPDDVILHWFTRDPKSGDTKVSTATLDEAGTFGEWPEDFADTELKAQADYLNASFQSAAK